MPETSPSRTIERGMQQFLTERAFKDDYHEQLANVRAETEHRLLLTVLAKRQTRNRRRRALKGWIVVTSMAGKMDNPDLELLRLEGVLLHARERLARITQLVPDPAVLRAAEELWKDAASAVRAHKLAAK